jgi:hypothetical protein
MLAAQDKVMAEQLAYAVSQQRTILTHNIRHFRLLNQRYHEEGRQHFGILLSAQVPLRDLLRRVLRFLGRHTADDVKNNVLWLDE